MQPNTEGAVLLRAFLDRLEWSPERLAREVNRLAGEELVSLKAPYGWLRGSVPRGRTCQYAALAISRGVGETIGAGILWPGSRAGGVALAAHHGLDVPWDADGVVRCAELIAEPTGGMLLAATGPMLVTCAVDWLTVPSMTPPTRALGEMLSPAAIDVLCERVAQLRRLDDTQASPMLLDWITRDFRWAAALAAGTSYGPETGAALFGVLAELGQLAGWVATDLDRHALGQRFFLAALRFAHAAGDRAMAANILSCLSYQVLWTGDPDSAIRIIRLARQSATAQVNELIMALLASREGRAHAARGDTESCELALRDAATAYAAFESNQSQTPAWSYWISEGVLEADAGRAWLEAGEPARAVGLLVRGLDLLGLAAPRNRALHELSLARAYLELGEIDAAVHTVSAALQRVPANGSSRVLSRLSEIHTELMNKRSRETDQLAEQISGLLAA